MVPTPLPPPITATAFLRNSCFIAGDDSPAPEMDGDDSLAPEMDDYSEFMRVMFNDPADMTESDDDEAEYVVVCAEEVDSGYEMDPDDMEDQQELEEKIHGKTQLNLETEGLLGGVTAGSRPEKMRLTATDPIVGDNHQFEISKKCQQLAEPLSEKGDNSSHSTDEGCYFIGDHDLPSPQEDWHDIGDDTPSPQEDWDDIGDDTPSPQEDWDDIGDDTPSPQEDWDDIGDDTPSPQEDWDDIGDDTPSPQEDYMSVLTCRSGNVCHDKVLDSKNVVYAEEVDSRYGMEDKEDQQDLEEKFSQLNLETDQEGSRPEKETVTDVMNETKRWDPSSKEPALLPLPGKVGDGVVMVNNDQVLDSDKKEDQQELEAKLDGNLQLNLKTEGVLEGVTAGSRLEEKRLTATDQISNVAPPEKPLSPEMMDECGILDDPELIKTAHDGQYYEANALNIVNEGRVSRPNPVETSSGKVGDGMVMDEVLHSDDKEDQQELEESLDGKSQLNLETEGTFVGATAGSRPERVTGTMDETKLVDDHSEMSKTDLTENHPDSGKKAISKEPCVGEKVLVAVCHKGPESWPSDQVTSADGNLLPCALADAGHEEPINELVAATDHEEGTFMNLIIVGVVILGNCYMLYKKSKLST